MRLALSLYSEFWEDFYESYSISKEHYLERYADDWSFLYIGMLRQFGVETTIYHFSRDSRRLEEYVHRPTGCTVKFLPSPRFHRSLYYLCYYTWWSGPWGPLRRLLYPLISYVSPLSLRFVRLLRRDRPDLLMQQDYEMGKFDVVALICKALSIPLVAFFTGGDSPRAEYERPLRRRTMQIPCRVVCMSQEECARVLQEYRLPADRVAYLPTPVDEVAFQPRSQPAARARLGVPVEGSYILFIGRLLNSHKGADVLLEAYAKVVQMVPDARLLLVGRGPDEDSLQEYAAAHELSGVLFRGWVDKEELPHYYNAADMLVLSSHHEGVPLIITEAMASALPVVSTDVGGVRDLLADGVSGFLVEAGDVEALADRILRLLGNPQERARLGMTGRQIVEQQFTREVVGRRFSQILHDCLPASSPALRS